MGKASIVLGLGLVLAGCGSQSVNDAKDAGPGRDASCVKTTCQAKAVECGAIDDGCGGQLDCGDTCALPKTCGGGGVANECGCTPETDLGFCERLGKDCDAVSAFDSCQISRTINCGICAGLDTCGGSGTVNVCGHPGDKCQDVTCNPGETCDTADWRCKCTSTSCKGPQVCSASERCVESTDPCLDKVCDSTLPSCVNVGGVATCQCTATSCPAPDTCDPSKTCVDKCQGVGCNAGETCDPTDGACKCSGVGTRGSCPAGCWVCSPRQRCVHVGDQCCDKDCSEPSTPLCIVEFGVAVCVCDSTSCPAGKVCRDGACVSAEICGNMIDDDGDGLTDCDDPDCADYQFCDGSGCDGSVGYPMCYDPICCQVGVSCGPGCSCKLSGSTSGTCAATESDCSDGKDNDGDGLTDCADSDCAGVSPCP
jgi:hypothetical protein